MVTLEQVGVIEVVELVLLALEDVATGPGALHPVAPVVVGLTLLVGGEVVLGRVAGQFFHPPALVQETAGLLTRHALLGPPAERDGPDAGLALGVVGAFGPPVVGQGGLGGGSVGLEQGHSVLVIEDAGGLEVTGGLRGRGPECLARVHLWSGGPAVLLLGQWSPSVMYSHEYKVQLYIIGGYYSPETVMHIYT